MKNEMKSSINKLALWLRLFVFLFLLHFGILNGHSEDVVAAKTNIPPFTAEGIVSWEGFEPSETNAIGKTEGGVLFLYSNDVWQIQFTYHYQNHYRSGLQAPRDIAGTMIDYRRIPDGTREITTFSSNALAPGVDIKKIRPAALVRTNRFPDMGQQELFLPWLSLCPKPELPLINSNLIHILFIPEFLNNPKNAGRFKLNYIEPEKQFLSELIVTNNGILFLADGSTLELTGSYTNGYPQFSYEVLETTNCDGINFPLNTVLYQFAPSPNGTSPEEIYPAVISRLNIKKIDVEGHHLILNPVPADLVALDSRPTGLNNGVTVNYHVTNDQWYAVTNKRLEQLAKIIKRQPRDKIKWGNEHSKNRAVVLTVLASITLVPLIGLVWKTKFNKKIK